MTASACSPPPPDAMTAASIPLPREVRGFVVLLALLQGALLYVVDIGHKAGWWPFAELAGRVGWYALAIAVPTTMMLSVQRLRDFRFWQQAMAVAVVVGALAGWAAWQAGGAAGLRTTSVLVSFGVTAGIGLVVALPWLQCRLDGGSWRAPYAGLVEHAWQNALTLVLAGAFTAICWGVLVLWATLFQLVDIAVFNRLFRQTAFIYLASGAMAGLGILIGRTQRRPVQLARQVLRALCKGLLPLLAFIALLFAIVLPFTGLEALWATRRAAGILIWLVALMVFFLNAVHQDGRGEPPYPLPLRRLVEAGLLTLPLFAGLALYALWLRVDQYGWTTDRYWALLLALVLGAYALGYAWAVLRRGAGWLAPLGGVNRALSWVVIGLALAVNSPLLDPLALAAASQAERLQRDDPRREAADDKRDIEVLRFELGRPGYRAAIGLRDTAAFAGDPARLAMLERVIARKERWERAASQEELLRGAARTVAEARALLRPAVGAEAADEAWLQLLVSGQGVMAECLQADSRCLRLSPDVDGDGVREVLLCDPAPEHSLPCALWVREADVAYGWSVAGRVWWYGDDAELESALAAGQLTVWRPRWPQLEVAGHRAEVREE